MLRSQSQQETNLNLEPDSFIFWDAMRSRSLGDVEENNTKPSLPGITKKGFMEKSPMLHCDDCDVDVNNDDGDGNNSSAIRKHLLYASNKASHFTKFIPKNVHYLNIS